MVSSHESRSSRRLSARQDGRRLIDPFHFRASVDVVILGLIPTIPRVKLTLLEAITLLFACDTGPLGESRALFGL